MANALKSSERVLASTLCDTVKIAVLAGILSTLAWSKYVLLLVGVASSNNTLFAISEAAKSTLSLSLLNGDKAKLATKVWVCALSSNTI